MRPPSIPFIIHTSSCTVASAAIGQLEEGDYRHPEGKQATLSQDSSGTSLSLGGQCLNFMTKVDEQRQLYAQPMPPIGLLFNGLSNDKSPGYITFPLH